MSSKKEEWDIKKDGKGTKTTTTTKDDGSQHITTQKAHTGPLGGKHAREIISEEDRTPSKKNK